MPDDMPKNTPVPNASAEIAGFLERHPETRTVEAFIFDLCGNAMGKRHPAEDLATLYGSGHQLCAAACLLDVTGNSADPLGYGVSDGDPDADALPIPGTLAPVPWADRPTAQVLLQLRRPDDGAPVWFEPRRVLERTVEAFAELALTPVVAVELEFFLIDRQRGADGAPYPPVSPLTGRRQRGNHVYGMEKLAAFDPVLAAIEEACAAQGVPAAAASSEYAPGQFEINLRHVADPVRAADHACLLKRVVKNVAWAQGYEATFLSKPYPDQSGSGLHIHLSLQTEDGGNAFDPGHARGDARLAHALGGLRATMAESMLLFAPNLNAYRRFAPDQYVPVTTDWGWDNRSVAFRVPSGGGAARRIEHRVAGAEANPYLVTASVLAGVHHGITRELDPGAPATGNAGSAVDPSLPLSFWRAADALATATILPDYLGGDYLAAYRTVKWAEFEDFMAVPSPREYDWYL